MELEYITFDPNNKTFKGSNTIEMALYLEFEDTLEMPSATPTQIKSPKLRFAHEPANRLAGMNKVDRRPQIDTSYDEKATVELAKPAHDRDNNALETSALRQDYIGFDNRESTSVNPVSVVASPQLLRMTAAKFTICVGVDSQLYAVKTVESRSPVPRQRKRTSISRMSLIRLYRLSKPTPRIYYAHHSYISNRRSLAS
jgi:hypothetical protein